MLRRMAAAAFAGMITLSTPARAEEISQDCFVSLISYAKGAPKVTPVSAKISEPLGLSPPATPFLSRQATIRDAGMDHAFAVGAEDSNKILLFKIDNLAKIGWFFVVTSTRSLTTAARVEGGKVTVQHIADLTVRAQFASEMEVWGSAKLDGATTFSCKGR